MAIGIKTGDNCLVIAGKDKGKTGKVMAVDPHAGRIVIEGVNIVHRHRKPRSAKDKGGIIKREAAIDISNVQIICAACNKATRIGHKDDGKGNKSRVCKKCGAVLIGTKRSAKSAKKEAKKEAKAEAKAAVKGAAASEKLAAKATKQSDRAKAVSTPKKAAVAKTTQKPTKEVKGASVSKAAVKRSVDKGAGAK